MGSLTSRHKLQVVFFFSYRFLVSKSRKAHPVYSLSKMCLHCMGPFLSLGPGPRHPQLKGGVFIWLRFQRLQSHFGRLHARWKGQWRKAAPLTAAWTRRGKGGAGQGGTLFQVFPGVTASVRPHLPAAHSAVHPSTDEAR